MEGIETLEKKDLFQDNNDDIQQKRILDYFREKGCENILLKRNSTPSYFPFLMTLYKSESNKLKVGFKKQNFYKNLITDPLI